MGSGCRGWYDSWQLGFSGNGPNGLWRWRWQNTRRTLALNVWSGTATKEDEPFLYLPFVETLESGLAQAASLDDFR